MYLNDIVQGWSDMKNIAPDENINLLCWDFNKKSLKNLDSFWQLPNGIQTINSKSPGKS